MTRLYDSFEHLPEFAKEALELMLRVDRPMIFPVMANGHNINVRRDLAGCPYEIEFKVN